MTSNYRRRSFKPIINPIKPAVKIPRSDPQLIYNSEVENNTIYEALAKTEDLVWCILRLEVSAHNPNQTVPGWTGFFAATSDRSEDVSNVTFLLSINQLPTKLSGIVEIVKQLKLKSQALSLKEVDLVADHAIFSKLLEVITGSDPEARSLINLRMGGFHIACVFLAVIGKRFAESGLSDLVVEAGILERAMNCKHYNNAVRMFKIEFEAFMGAKIDCFIEWIQASSKDNYLINFLESENFQNLLIKQDNESLKQCVATIVPIANLMDRYDEMLSDPTENGSSAAF